MLQSIFGHRRRTAWTVAVLIVVPVLYVLSASLLTSRRDDSAMVVREVPEGPVTCDYGPRVIIQLSDEEAAGFRRIVGRPGRLDRNYSRDRFGGARDGVFRVGEHQYDWFITVLVDYADPQNPIVWHEPALQKCYELVASAWRDEGDMFDTAVAVMEPLKDVPR